MGHLSLGISHGHMSNLSATERLILGLRMPASSIAFTWTGSDPVRTAARMENQRSKAAARNSRRRRPLRTGQPHVTGMLHGRSHAMTRRLATLEGGGDIPWISRQHRQEGTPSLKNWAAKMTQFELNAQSGYTENQRTELYTTQELTLTNARRSPMRPTVMEIPIASGLCRAGGRTLSGGRSTSCMSSVGSAVSSQS